MRFEILAGGEDEHPESNPVLSDEGLAEMDGWYASIYPSQQ